MTLADRFWLKVQKGSGCWLWTGGKHGRGYGGLHCGGKVFRKYLQAHRVSWELHHGPIPDGLWVLHKCDNPICVNPDHLFLGTRQDNMGDCAAKGRIKTTGKANLTHCKRGHPFTLENTRIDGRGHRRCLPCERAYVRPSRARK